MKLKNYIPFFIIFLIIIFSIIIIKTRAEGNIETELIKCIGENSELYIQNGCHACEKQIDYLKGDCECLTIIDCWKEQDKCIEKQITATPTWIIKNQRYIGFQSLEKLKELTNC
jgi:hypothetical protein